MQRPYNQIDDVSGIDTSRYVDARQYASMEYYEEEEPVKRGHSVIGAVRNGLSAVLCFFFIFIIFALVIILYSLLDVIGDQRKGWRVLDLARHWYRIFKKEH